MSTKTKFCKHCGTQIDIDARFCAACGGEQTSSSQPIPQESQTIKNPNPNTSVSQSPQSTIVQGGTQMGKTRSQVQPKIWTPYLPKDEAVTRSDFINGLKFDYRSTVKISHSTGFTALGFSLYLIASLLNALTIVVALILFDIENDVNSLISIFNVIYLALILFFLLLTYFLTYLLKNTDIHVDYANGIRLGGFLSIILLLRALIGIFYAGYVRLFVTGADAEGIFLLFEFNSYWITALVLLIHLIIYLKNRIGMSATLAFIFVFAASVLSTLMLTPVFYILSIFLDYQIFNYALLILSISTPFILIFGQDKIKVLMNSN